VISVEDLLFYVDEALDGMVEIVTGLGDRLANIRPELPGANSPYVILTHCLGVMEYWGGDVIAGRTIERDRDAEFRASGPVGPLVERTRRARRQLEADLSHLDPFASPRGNVEPEDAALPLGRTQGGALIHLYEELAQHRGQMEGCRDVLLAGAGPVVLDPIGVVRGGRTESLDDDWAAVEATLALDGRRFPAEAVAGLGEFSHVDVVFLFHLVDPGDVHVGARRPRGRADWPAVGIFAQRAKARPNRIGVTTCELLGVDDLDLAVRGLDAVDGTPVLDVKPYMAEFGPRGPTRQPAWSHELMEHYWSR
jgi:tRNA-Thr(GGU) m(6)t(6)A37 methyltransferase TsaA